MNDVHDAQRLLELQSLPLERKIQITQTRIIEWYQHFGGKVCISFSGGKDSTVLLHIARSIYPEIHAVFSNTGLEYPEIQRFVRGFENVDIVTPKQNFKQVVRNDGYPLIGKEVAEAIYYARKIRSHSVKAEREREAGYTRSHADEHCKEPPHRFKRQIGGGQNHPQKTNGTLGKQTEFKRIEIRGLRKAGVTRKCYSEEETLPG